MLARAPWDKDLEGSGGGGEGQAKQLVNIEGSPSPNSRALHLNKYIAQGKNARRPSWMNKLLLGKLRERKHRGLSKEG